MSWLVSALGAVVVAAVVRDIFHTLFHPSGQGALSWRVLRGVWRVSAALGHRRLGGLEGPLGVSAVIVVWALLLVSGWALVYWLHLDESFSFSSGLAPAARSDLLDAAYLALVTGATLGYGDIVPTTGWLRVAAPVQAFMGFGLLTAAVTWVLQIYPALRRRRALALRMTMLRRTLSAPALAGLDSPWAAAVLDGLGDALVAVRVDLTQYSETYFFREAEPDAAIAVQLAHAADLARAGAGARRCDVRAAAGVLRTTLDDLAGFLDTQFLHVGGTPEEALAAFARDHGHEPGAG